MSSRFTSFVFRRLLGLAAAVVLAAAGPFALAQVTYTWTAGDIVSGTITPSGVTTINGVDILNIVTSADHTFNGTNVTNNGTVDWQGGYFRSGYNATFANASGGVFVDSASSVIDNPFGGGYGFLFANAGQYRKTAAGVTAVNTTFDNSGTILVQAGEFQLNAGGTNTGSFQADSGTIVTFANNYTLSNGTTLNGAGLFQQVAGTLAVNGSLAVSNLTLFGGVVSGTHSLSGNYFWVASDLSTVGTTTVTSGSMLTIISPNNHDFNSRTFVNNGTVDWQAGRLRSGYNAVFTNASGATFIDAADSHMENTFGGGYSFTFDNQGTYNKTSSGTSNIDIAFNNTATVNVTGGTLALNGGGTNSGTGVFQASAGTTVAFNANYTLSSGSQLLGSGLYQLNGGTLVATGQLTVGRLDLVGGGFVGTHTLHGNYYWAGTDLNDGGAGTTTIAGDGVFNVINAVDHNFNKHGFVNNGTFNWQAGQLRSGYDATFNNAAAGTFNDTASATIDNPFGGGYNFFFVNNGLYNKTASGTTSVNTSFDNNGTVSVQAGTFAINAGGTNSSTGVFQASAGTVVAFNSNYTLATGTQLNGAGTYQVNAGTLYTSGILTVSRLDLLAGGFVGTTTLHGNYFWTATDLNDGAAGTTTIAADGIFSAISSNDHNFNKHNFVNNGVFNWQGGYLRSGYSGTFVNNATFNDSASSHLDNPFGGGYGFVFTNNGTYNKTASGTTSLDTTFDNNGTLSVQTGTLAINAGGTNSSSGAITTLSGATTQFNSSYTLASGTMLNGAGIYQLNGGTLNVTGNLTATNLNFLAGTLAGTQTLHGSGYIWTASDWSTGGTTTIASDGVLTIVSAADHPFNTRNLTNNGTINWQGGVFKSGYNAVFTNSVGAFFNDSADNHINNPFGGGYGFTFANNGTYNKTGPGATDLDTTFDNAGTVAIAAGTFRLNGGGSNASTGNFVTATGAAVQFASNYTMLGGTVMSGTGTFLQTAGTLSLTGNITASNFTFQAGVLISSHTLHGSGYNWAASDFSSAGTTTLASDGVMAVTGTNDHNFNTRNFINQGIVNWQAGALRSGYNATFTNSAGATFNDNATDYHIDNPFGGGYGFTFDNNGTYNKTVASNTYVDITFNNNATVSILAGTFKLGGGGTNSSTGVFNTAGGATTLFTTNYSLADGTQLNGAGVYRLTGGLLSLAGQLNASLLELAGGSLAGTHTLHGAYDWSTTDLSTIGTTTVASDGILSVTGTTDHNFNTRTFVNNGTVNWQGGYFRSGYNATFTNSSGATFNDSAAGYHMDNPFGGGYSFTFYNSGTYVKTAGTSQIDVTFINTGLVSVTGGSLVFNAGLSNSNGSILLANGGLLTSSASIVGLGSLGGTGTVTAPSLSVAGMLSPGSSPGQLNITGDLTLLGGAISHFDVGGTTQGSNYDFLSVSGNATLNGDLVVTFANGFETSVLNSQNFTIVNATALSGVFSNVANGSNVATSDGAGYFQVNYTATSVTLSNFVPVPEPSTYALLALGLAAAAGFRRRTRAQGKENPEQG